MLLRRLELQNFRNLEDKNFIFSEGVTVIVGPNGAGKTNILEGIYLLSSGKSFRADLEREMIKVGTGFARVAGEIESDSVAQLPGNTVTSEVEEVGLEVVLAGEHNDNMMGTAKKFLVNGVSRRLYDFAGNLRAVVFGPWDLELVTGSPGTRRRFLDGVLSQVDREYRRSLLSYEKGLRQRNRILERIREGEANRSQLLFWDRLVVKNGDYISQKREEVIEFVNQTGGLGGETFALDYDKSAISEERLAQYAKEEVAAAATLVGPHRDDMKFKIQNSKFKTQEGGNLATYGSRGEQRMGVLWLKLAELRYVEEQSQQQPILLLDDIFSELDHQHHQIVVSAVGSRQTFITTTDLHAVSDWKNKALLVEL